jgi:glycosyltransferase involved in cell wall biosynthesis
MKPLPTVSVIIPTYNRKNMLRDTLNTISRQTYPVDLFDVIVVDDGSDDGTNLVTRETFPFRLLYQRQSNQGDAAARNLGVSRSRNELLLFLDDDILVDENFMVNLICQHVMKENRIVVGMERLWPRNEDSGNGTSPFSSTTPDREINPARPELEPISFTEICSNNFSIRREDYHLLGEMQALDFPGSSIWCDVDFSYRAYRNGFEFYRSNTAVCWHRDYVTQNLENHSRRMYEAAYRAVSLFQKYPELPPHIPMFRDKLPVNWSEDSIRLIIRKFMRRTSALRPVIWLSKNAYNFLKRRVVPNRFVRPVYRLVIGGHLYNGYRDGLRDFS